jgi:hypothetical protein
LSCHEFGYAGILSSSPQPGERETDSRFQDEETLGTALLREAGNNDRHGREHAQGGYDLALSLDEFRTGEDVRTALNVLREHLSRGGTFVVSCRIAAATGLHLPSGELAFRLETMAKLLRDYFGVVTYAFLHGDEFKAEWNQYSDRAVFFCRFLKSRRPAETSWPVEELDKTYGGSIKGLVPFSPEYLRLWLNQDIQDTSKGNGGNLLFFLQPLPLYGDPLLYRQFLSTTVCWGKSTVNSDGIRLIPRLRS